MLQKLLAVLLLPFGVWAQNTIAFPEVINYNRHQYRGGLQNWDIQQDANGHIYIANNEGLLSFDGRYWQLYPLPNKTIVRSVAPDANGHIYVGGQDELGYFAPSKNGSLAYHSLIKLLPEKERSFGDVWDIVIYKKSVFFRTTQRIFQFRADRPVTYPAPLSWSYMGLCNGKLYAHDLLHGLLQYEQNLWQPLQIKSKLPANDPVTAMVAVGGNAAYITTLKNGIFVYSNGVINKHPTPNNALFAEDRIYAATSIDDNWLALATNNRGVYIIDRQGDIVQQFTKTENLQNNNVLSIFLDQQKNMWLGLDNGIDFIAYNSAIKQINPMRLDGSGYTALIHNNRLYAGTSNGLYQVQLQPVTDLSFSKGNFEPVQNTKGQTWALAAINNQVLLGHHEGAFLIEGTKSRLLSAVPGFWNFVPLSPVFPANRVAAGSYNGVGFLNFNKGQFIPNGMLPGFTESSRYLCTDQTDHLWVSHPYHGVYRLDTSITNPVTKVYDIKKGLPATLNNHVFRIRNEIVAGTDAGVYRYNAGTDRFEPHPFYQPLLGTKSIRYLRDDQEGNVWFIHEKTLGVIDLAGTQPKVIYLPELNNKMLSGFEFLYPVNEHNLFLGGEKGFYHINYAKYKKNVPVLTVELRRVLLRHTRDSLLYGGFRKPVEEIGETESAKIPRISSAWKSIILEFASSLYGYQSNLEYSYRLKGFDPQWSEWSSRTDKEYTNLSEGTYTFEVKTRNNLGNESKPAVFSFTILPPWYEALWIKIGVVLVFIFILYLLYRWQERRFRQQMVQMEEEQKRLTYIHELERSKTESELVTLRNAKLEAEINFKNSEMASSAMHLLKKGELLSKIKAELSQMSKRLDNEQAIAEIRKMIRSLHEEENIDQEWESFSKHFDKVHGDFVVHLKELHPNLTANELKLSTYLRMNLSTKEIAQLLNISVRGVEIARYRLRKKLMIPSEKSLFDYLINIH